MRIGNYVPSNDSKTVYLESKLRRILLKAINSKDNTLLLKIGSINNLIKTGNIEEAERELKNAERKISTTDINKKSTISIISRQEYKKNTSKMKNPKTEDFSSKNDKIYLQDNSPDEAVSFQYPTAVPESASFLFINAHEGEHAREIIKEAMFKGKMAQVYVRYFTSYDSDGRLVYTGGITWGKVLDTKG
ncbi:hypothetical protein SAMN02745164_00761 [Marinitoga hydrogenitolerans DSM 16785]|uniref:Uncharacterized protein n=1 Tax=Marinitoga hydrogenitolerans (strain DSM 16785 / JCM 12826 / AT1271) TaxID=1122195 RepID=A0A1M4USH9_MARH1|nr:hypothetical protein [Marinitoga hydrogenitolerans]SHE59701.1 hypothetical protein SAMN02745164_00761 [Marinitoga hydrogenitolerans DSM 16785]